MSETYLTDLSLYKPATWRVLHLLYADGPANMAVDEAIAESVGAHRQMPTLRFYGWQPGCLSLGFAQPAADADLDRISANGWQIVRRLSGGRAILHIDEITYSIAAPVDEPRVTGGVVESYLRLSRGLLTGLNLLGLTVHSDKVDKEPDKAAGPVCFEVPSDYEITVSGRKLLGSAQTRRFDAVLQHGALPLYGDITRIVDALAFNSEAERETTRRRVHERAINLEQVMGSSIPAVQVQQALIQGFEQALNLRFEAGQLSDEEQERATELRETRYNSDSWTYRR